MTSRDQRRRAAIGCCCFGCWLLLLAIALRCLALPACCCTRARVSCWARPALRADSQVGAFPSTVGSGCSPSERPQRRCKMVLKAAETRRRALRPVLRSHAIMPKKTWLALAASSFRRGEQDAAKKYSLFQLVQVQTRVISSICLARTLPKLTVESLLA